MGDMNWMDGELCGNGPEHCNMNPAYLSNWRLTTNDGPAPAPPPPAPTPAGGGKCCWGGCTNCNNDPSHWCNQNQQSCQSCMAMVCLGSTRAVSRLFCCLLMSQVLIQDRDAFV